MSGVKVELKYGIEIAGATVKVLHMRAPTVGDTLAADRLSGSDAEKEITIFANLCEIAPNDLHKMHLADYKRLQDAWRGFFD